MKKQGYKLYALTILMLATLIVSIIGTVTMLSATSSLSKQDNDLAKVKVQKMAEPTIENAKIRLVVPEREMVS